jgi:hypothetical protein
MENIRVRLGSGFHGRILRNVSNANPTGGIKGWDNAAFGVQPQGYGRRIDRRARQSHKTGSLAGTAAGFTSLA